MSYTIIGGGTGYRIQTTSGYVDMYPSIPLIIDTGDRNTASSSPSDGHSIATLDPGYSEPSPSPSPSPSPAPAPVEPTVPIDYRVKYSPGEFSAFNVSEYVLVGGGINVLKQNALGVLELGVGLTLGSANITVVTDSKSPSKEIRLPFVLQGLCGVLCYGTEDTLVVYARTKGHTSRTTIPLANEVAFEISEDTLVPQMDMIHQRYSGTPASSDYNELSMDLFFEQDGIITRVYSNVSNIDTATHELFSELVVLNTSWVARATHRMYASGGLELVQVEMDTVDVNVISTHYLYSEVINIASEHELAPARSTHLLFLEGSLATTINVRVSLWGAPTHFLLSTTPEPREFKLLRCDENTHHLYSGVVYSELPFSVYTGRHETHSTTPALTTRHVPQVADAFHSLFTPDTIPSVDTSMHELIAHEVTGKNYRYAFTGLGQKDFTWT